MSADDAELVLRTLAGDRTAFEVLVAAHLRRARALARVVVHEDSAIDDVVQEAFLRAYTHLSGLGVPAHFPSWLGTIVRNEAVTWLRRNARARLDPGLIEPPAPEISEADPRARGLPQALAQLSPAYREVIALKYEAGLDYAQIAETLGLSAANVEKRLYRARLALGRALDMQTDAADG